MIHFFEIQTMMLSYRKQIIIPINTTTEYVHSRQGKNTNFNELSMAAKVNKMFDKIANQHARGPIQIHIPNNPIEVYVNGKC